MTEESSSLFVHPADESLLSEILEKVNLGSANIFVLGQDEFRLDIFFLAFYKELRANDRIEVHRMMAPSIDETVSLINSLSDTLTIEQASKARSGGGKHVLIVSDMGPSTSEEWSACESLVSTFPGTNVSLVAFTCNEGEKAASFRGLGTKSRNALVELPELSEEIVLRFLDRARSMGHLDDVVNSLLNSRWHSLVTKTLATSAAQSPISEDFVREAASDESFKGDLDRSTESEVMLDPLADEGAAEKTSMPLTLGVVYISFLLLASLALLNYLGFLNIDASRFLEKSYEFIDSAFTSVMVALNDLLDLLGKLVRELNLGT
jgi:hypothetical protein